MTNHQDPLRSFWACLVQTYDFTLVSKRLSEISPNQEENQLTLQQFEQSLLDAVVFIASSSLYQEYSNFLLKGDLSSDLSFSQFSSKHSFLEVLKAYPELARILDIRINAAISCTQAALACIKTHLDLIVQKLQLKTLDCITFTAFLSDPHNNGQQVIKFTFNRSIGIYYKPKSLWTDIYFDNLMRLTLEKLSLPFNPQSTIYVSTSSYSLMNELSQAVPIDEKVNAEISGVLLYLAYFTRTTDLIQDNVIQTCFGLKAIDTEFIFCPKLDKLHFNQGNYFLESVLSLERSCIDTALLPRWLITGRETKDVSGFCGHFFTGSSETRELAILPTGVLSWDIRYERANKPDKNAVSQFHKTKESILSGFTKAYLINEFITEAHTRSLSNIANHERVTRFTFRPTMAYAEIMRASFTHTCCLSRQNRHQFILEAIKESGSSNGKLSVLKYSDREKIYLEEATALDKLDIPLFQFNQITNSLHLIHTNQTIDLTYLNLDYDCTPRMPLAGDHDLSSQQNAISFSFEAFFEKFSYLNNLPGLKLFSDIDNSSENMELWNHIFSKCEIHSQKSRGDSSSIIIKHLLQPSFAGGYVQIGMPGPGLWNGLIGILLADFYQKSKLYNSWDILGQGNDPQLGESQLKKALLDISDKFGFGNSSGITCLTLLRHLQFDSRIEESNSKAAEIIIDLVLNAVRDYYSKGYRASSLFHSELDLYDGLLGTLASVCSYGDNSIDNALEKHLLDEWSLKLSESLALVSCITSEGSFADLSKCLRTLSLAHGAVGTAIAFQRLNIKGDQFDSLLESMLQALDLFFEKNWIVNACSKASVSEKQSLLANCNGLGGIALGLTRLKNAEVDGLIIKCTNYFVQCIDSIRNQLASEPLSDGSSSCLCCDSPLPHAHCEQPLDYSLCCGISGTLTTLAEVNKCLKPTHQSREIIFCQTAFLTSLLNSYRRNLVEGKLVIPHRRDLSLFKGLGGVFLALEKKYDLCARIAMLEVYFD